MKSQWWCLHIRFKKRVLVSQSAILLNNSPSSSSFTHSSNTNRCRWGCSHSNNFSSLKALIIKQLSTNSHSTIINNNLRCSSKPWCSSRLKILSSCHHRTYVISLAVATQEYTSVRQKYAVKATDAARWCAKNIQARNSSVKRIEAVQSKMSAWMMKQARTGALSFCALVYPYSFSYSWRWGCQYQQHPNEKAD